MKNFNKRLADVIPGGAHTYSRGVDQYPSNAPQILTKGKGAYVYDNNNKKFLDYGMGLRAVGIGYAEESINNAAIKEINMGVNLTKPSMIELEAAELFVDLIDSVDMVKFTKNGSSAVSAAVKLARAFTGKGMIARCSDHPFFSYDDWFIGSTEIKRGIPQTTINDTKLFPYNNIQALKNLFDKFPNEFACLVMEPATLSCPATFDSQCCNTYPCKKEFNAKEGNYLKEVETLCKQHGVIFILDEMITGFRWHIKGAQHLYGLNPDISTFGKAMANGYSLACVGGKREIMSLGSINNKGQERVFLLSTTHGSEMPALGAFVSTIDFMKKNNVIHHLWDYGNKLINMMNEESSKVGLSNYFVVSGVPCAPYFFTKDNNKNLSLEFRTLFMQEMIENNILIPWIALSYRHDAKELELTRQAVRKSLLIYKKALDLGIDKFLKSPVIKPVFRKYN